MKKWIGLLFSLLCISMFSACSNQHQISGEIIETNIDENIGIVSFVVRTDEKDIGILMTDETAVFSLAEGMTYQEFYEGTFTKIMVTLGKQYFFCE